MSYLSELSKEQHTAVTAPLAPLQVIAGAGSGKTRVLVSRISWMIEEKGVEPKDIFVSAFTKAAAKEIQERVVDITRASELEVATFHAHFYKLLNEYRKENNKSSLDVCREAEKRKILTSLLSKPSKDYPQAINMMGDVIAIGNYISVWKDELLEPHSQDINAVLTSSKPNSDIYIAARVYPLYDAELRRLNKLDFDSMLFESWKLLSSDKAFLAKVKAKWKAFMLDEAQDLNTAQWEILRLMAPPQESPNLTIVGDTRQCVASDQYIWTENNQVLASQIQPGDKILSSSEGKIVNRKVIESSSMETSNFIEFKTESGKVFKVTPDHQVFASIGKTDLIYVYLMWRYGYGYRVGTYSPSGPEFDKGTVRTGQEGADRMWFLTSCKGMSEALQMEHSISYFYGVPMTPFKYREEGMFNSQEEIKAFFQPFKYNGENILRDFGLDFERPTHKAKSSNSGRVNVNLVIGTKGGTQVHFESSNIPKKVAEDIGATLSDRGTYRLRMWIKDPYIAEITAIKIAGEIGGSICRTLSMPRSSLEPHRRVFITTASCLHEGMLVPEAVNGELKLVPIVSRRELKEQGTAIDFSIEKDPSFVINGVLVHNCLYRFRGAVPELTDSFEHVYRNVKIVNLSTNYRSSDYIIEVSNNLVKSLALPDQKPAVKTESKYPVAIEFKDTAEQSAEIINLVTTMKQRGYKGGDVAVLMRTNAQSLEIEQSFVSAGLPYWCRTGGFFDRLEIGDIMAYLRLSQDHSDVDSLGKIINRPTRYLGRMYVERVEEVANLGDGDLINAMRVVDKYTTKRMFDKQVLAANDLADLIEFIRDMSPAQAIQKILDSTDYLKWLAVNNGLSAGSDDSRKDNIDALLSSANKYRTIKDFIAFADESSRLQIESGQSTEICTIHGAKGREWHTVFVSTFVDDFIPHSKAVQTPHGLEDERRAAYVAFTRAKRNLILGVPSKTMPNRSLAPSRFLKDSQIDIEVLKGSNWEQFIQV